MERIRSMRRRVALSSLASLPALVISDKCLASNNSQDVA
jgi:hypothetical protein